MEIWDLSGGGGDDDGNKDEENDGDPLSEGEYVLLELLPLLESLASSPKVRQNESAKSSMREKRSRGSTINFECTGINFDFNKNASK